MPVDVAMAVAASIRTLAFTFIRRFAWLEYKGRSLSQSGMSLRGHGLLGRSGGEEVAMHVVLWQL